MDFLCGIDHPEFSECLPLNGPKTPHRLPQEQPFGVAVAKAPDHLTIIRVTYNISTKDLRSAILSC